MAAKGGMKVFVVVDHICEADIVVAVFSTKEKADTFVRENNWPTSKTFKYEDLEAVEFELDQVPA